VLGLGSEPKEGGRLNSKLGSPRGPKLSATLITAPFKRNGGGGGDEGGSKSVIWSEREEIELRARKRAGVTVMHLKSSIARQRMNGRRF
jgi:hypothetical protein